MRKLILILVAGVALGQPFVDALNRGVAAYKEGKYPDAVVWFKQAVALDEKSADARVYLATAYMTQWIPGATSQENQMLAQSAESEFRQVLDMDPKHKVALASLASLAYNQATASKGPIRDRKMDEAADWNRRLTVAEPENKEAWYSLGVIAWARFYPQLMEAREKTGMKQEDPGPLRDPALREALKAKWETLVNEGLEDLKQALKLDPEYDDAMAYTNLLIRERADWFDSPQEYKAAIAEADRWVSKALETKRRKAARR